MKRSSLSACPLRLSHAGPRNDAARVSSGGGPGSVSPAAGSAPRRPPVTPRPLGILLFTAMLLGGCDGTPPRHVPGGDASTGRAALRNFGCGACHVIPGIPGADGRVAPPLSAFAERAYVAGVVGNSAENLVSWIVNPQAINPGTAMPNLDVSETQARHMAAYLYTLR
jgi:cytochrome c